MSLPALRPHKRARRELVFRSYAAAAAQARA